MNVRKKYQAFVNLGTSPQFSVPLNKKIVLTNNFSIIGSSNIFLFLPVYFSFGQYVSSLIHFFVIITWLLIPYLQKIGRVSLARSLICPGCAVVIATGSFHMGLASNCPYFFHAAFIAPFLVFRASEKKLILFNLFVLILGLFGLHITNYLGYKYDNGLSQEMQAILHFAYLLATTTTTIFTAFILFYNNDLAERELAKQKDMILEKNKEITDLLENMSQGILSLGAGLEILPGYSNHCLQIFQRDSLQGINFGDLLHDTDLSPDAISQIRSLAMTCIGEDKYNFEFNSHVLPKKIRYKEEYFYDLHWSTICTDQSTVDKIMVVLIDITNETHLYEKKAKIDRNVEVINQIVAAGAKSFSTFLLASKEALQASVDIIASNQGRIPEEEALDELFRNLHTIKGNARVFHFSYIVNSLHDTESDFIAFQKSKGNKEAYEMMLDSLNRSKEALVEYENVFLMTFSKANGDFEAKATHELIEKFESEIKSVDIASLSACAENFFASYHKITAQPLDKVLYKQIRSLPEISKTLAKGEPVVQIHNNGVLIPLKYQQIYQDFFNHLFRNSIDHGFSEEGSRNEIKISLNHNREDKQLVIIYRDHGKGIDLKAIEDKAKAFGLLNSAKQDDLALAKNIFKRGFSTKKLVTAISGRGVGMDVVKDRVTKLGGNIDIVWDSQQRASDGRRKFHFKISIPFD